MAFTGNSNYAVATYTAFAVEQSLSKNWSQIWTQGHPLLRVISDKATNFNTGFDVQGNNKVILPVVGDDLTNAVAGVADANELTADTVGITNGFSQAAYEITHYRGHFRLRESEAKLAKGGSRGNIVQGKVDQLLESFKNRWSTDAAGSAVDSRTAVMGMRYALSTSNTVGGISQSTDTNWAATVTASAGTFALTLIDNAKDTIDGYGRHTADIVLASNTGGTNTYGKIRTAIGPAAERLVNVKDGTAKYGLTNIEYLGTMVTLNNRGASGEILVLSSDSWYVLMAKKPTMHPMIKLPGTDAYEQSATMWSCLAVSDPQSNARISGVT